MKSFFISCRVRKEVRIGFCRVKPPTGARDSKKNISPLFYKIIIWGKGGFGARQAKHWKAPTTILIPCFSMNEIETNTTPMLIYIP